MMIVIYDYHIFIVQATASRPHLGQGTDKLERLSIINISKLAYDW
jgi:hypothetical protein